MGDILHFTYLYLYIYTLLVINKPYGSLAVKVSIHHNITGFLGNNDTPLTCSFIKEEGEQISSVQIIATNKTDDFNDMKPIAIFIPDEPAKLPSLGYYLNGRVTLTNITDASTNATLTFHLLKCEDEKDYICRCFFKDVEHIDSSQSSQPTRIFVQATSSKPDNISSIIVSSTKTEMQEFGFSVSNTSLSTKTDDISTIQTSLIDTVTTTDLQSTENPAFVFHEGDTVMFTCTGNIGNPPGKLIWQKMFPHEKKPITYANESTDIEKILGKCSFKGTSYLTVKIYTDDIEAKLRCFEESQVNVLGMYIETKPFNVYFQINHVDINKQPNQKQYGPKTDKITLTCKGNGNPAPQYIWFKEGKNNSILSNTSVYVIANVIRNNSGMYFCEAYNILGDINYRESNSVEINIVDELQSSQESDWWNVFKEYKTYFMYGAVGVGFVVLCVVIWCCCFRRKRKENKGSCSLTSKSDDIIISAEYVTVSHTNSNIAGKTRDHLMVFNGMDGNQINCRNKQEDLVKTVDANLQTTSYHTNEYAVPSDTLQEGNVTCRIGPGFTSFKDPKDI